MITTVILIVKIITFICLKESHYTGEVRGKMLSLDMLNLDHLWSIPEGRRPAIIGQKSPNSRGSVGLNI